MTGDELRTIRIRILPPAPAHFCPAWHARAGLHRFYGATCCFCERDVAAPEANKTVACIYCGLDRGLVPAIEVPPD
jgi:hypothetical protein